MNERLKAVGQTAGNIGIGAVVVLAIVVLFAAFFWGVRWLIENILGWAVLVGALLLAVDFLILLPLALIRPLRRMSATIMFMSTYVFGLVTWLYGFAFAYTLWGALAVIIGCFFMGVGVIFIGVLATAFNGMWVECATLVILTILTIGVRMLSLWIGDRSSPPYT